ncbi:hypothetical protein QBC38DRAFT_446522 [Podospora fimiseda]|uniref:Rhodopsin domain-containing protein n=1 Tax=Podospora fimiseda TaxID=252190 RepID=A0AAN7BIY3_9PEZI|nr:hypothetical protein QBC38DRAFT_446522 [Podospora fimiseda]
MPAMRPPSGMLSNFDHPPNLNTISYLTLSLSLGLCTFALVLRIYSRWFVIHKPSVVDYCLIISYTTGMFVHQWDIRLIELPSFLRGAFISALIVVVFTPIGKAAILLEWIRIFSPGTRDYVFWSCHILIWSNVVCYLVLFLCLNIACTPYEYNWNRLIVGGSCGRINTGIVHEATGAINLVTDVLIFLIPQHAIWKLKMSRQRKMGVAAIFAIGILGIAAAAGRLAASVIRNRSTDFTYTMSSIMLCAEAEWGCSMLVVCGPAVPQAFAAISKKIDTMRTSRKESKSGSGNQSATPSLPSIPLAKLRPARTGYEDLEDGSILRQTEFATEEEYVDAPREGSAHGRQHPWTAEK